jgi:hypothetical protein
MELDLIQCYLYDILFRKATKFVYDCRELAEDVTFITEKGDVQLKRLADNVRPYFLIYWRNSGPNGVFDLRWTSYSAEIFERNPQLKMVYSLEFVLQRLLPLFTLFLSIVDVFTFS